MFWDRLLNSSSNKSALASSWRCMSDFSRECPAPVVLSEKPIVFYLCALCVSAASAYLGQPQNCTKETLINSEFQRRTDAPPFLIALSD